jgi:hypothetical protein
MKRRALKIREALKDMRTQDKLMNEEIRQQKVRVKILENTARAIKK